ncbi:hypothetical protein BJ684DRAFT_16922 [Piptocephalis cylindrospora]|uniref:Uncharacterized protein n=1 Tax=Piptocephalis cylindrospora TaxID=1907219 RepID=A0A4P9Y1E8_9FUNG|nr:hypothetical protein BJ684DRAFT_16922 [Piptocephalis cylindrospora]|eukprot:RKP12607.1 hypothetical protein BJ684DRAFT_16922 [Piptocephalis cylindrospora]
MINDDSLTSSLKLKRNVRVDGKHVRRPQNNRTSVQAEMHEADKADAMEDKLAQWRNCTRSSLNPGLGGRLYEWMYIWPRLKYGEGKESRRIHASSGHLELGTLNWKLQGRKSIEEQSKAKQEIMWHSAITSSDMLVHLWSGKVNGGKGDRKSMRLEEERNNQPVGADKIWEKGKDARWGEGHGRSEGSAQGKRWKTAPDEDQWKK